MMRKKFTNLKTTYFKLLTILFITLNLPVYGQLTIGNGKHVLEIGGAITTFYNHRFYTNVPNNRINNDPNQPIDKKKNRFGLRDAQLQLEGRVGHDFEYELQVDFADFANQTDLGENPGIMDANFTYKGFKIVDATIGYQKLPYGRNSLVPFVYSPYWIRPELTRGELFSRRDAGITLSKNFWHQRINVYAGAYSGMGEQLLSKFGGDNDPSGSLEYVGRVDLSYPARYRYRDFDVNHAPIPMFSIGVNARSVFRKFSSFLPGDDYYLRNISGQKSIIGADFSFQYQGFSAQLEWHQLKISPTDYIDPDINSGRFREDRGTKQSKIGEKPTVYFKAGGLVAQMSYFVKPIKTIISSRYDNLNPNDLVIKNTEETISFAAAYMINGFNAMFKAQYQLRLVDRKNPSLQRIDDQIRLGMQFLLR